MKTRLKWVGIIFVVLMIIGVSHSDQMKETSQRSDQREATETEAQQNETDHEWVNSHFDEMMKAAQRFEEESKKRKKSEPEIVNERLYHVD